MLSPVVIASLLLLIYDVTLVNGDSSDSDSSDSDEKSGKTFTLAEHLNLEYCQSLTSVTDGPTIYGTKQVRHRLHCFGVPFSGFDFVAEFKDGVFTGRTDRTTLPSCCTDSIHSQLYCSRLASNDPNLAAYKAEYLRQVDLDPDTGSNYVVTQTILRRVRQVEQSVGVVDEVLVLWEGCGVAARVFIVMDACDRSLLHISNRLAFSSDTRDGNDTMAAVRPRRDASSDEDNSDGHCPVGTGGNAALGAFSFGPGSDDICLDVNSDNGFCSMDLEGTTIHDGQYSYNKQCTEDPVATFYCSEGPQDDINNGFSPILDAGYAVTIISGLLSNWYQALGVSQLPPVCTHFGSEVVNSLWTGRAILLGDGQHGKAFPFTTVHGVCHEFGHFITESMSDLLLVGQSGGISDAFSDAFAKVCEAYENDGQVSNWKLGVGLIRYGPRSDALRYFDDPTRDGHSIANAADFVQGMNSHFSCGVYNRFFYCLVQEKRMAVSEAFSLYVWANKLRWNSNVNFEEAAEGILATAYDTGIDTRVVLSCFQTVGLLLNDGAQTLQDMERVVCPNKLTKIRVQGSRHRIPYLRVCASPYTGIKVSADNAYIRISRDDLYGDIVSQNWYTTTYTGSLSAGNLYITFQGYHSYLEHFPVSVKFF